MSKVTKDDRLDGWDAISSYLGWHQRTAIRWEKLKGLPIHRVGGGKRQPVYAYRNELDAWFQKNGGALQKSKRESGEEAAPNQVQSLTPKSPLWKIRDWRVLAAVAVPVIVCVSAITWKMPLLRPRVKITGIRQLTADGNGKNDLIAGNGRLYFSESIGDSYKLSWMPLNGGPIKQVQTSVENVFPADISSDGRLLLVQPHDYEAERPVWIVPSDGGEAHRVGNLMCLSATWLPDGSGIVFGKQDSLFVSDMDGKKARLIAQLDGSPRKYLWSHDGTRLWIYAESVSKQKTSLWRADFDRGYGLKQIKTISFEDGINVGPLTSAKTDAMYFSVPNDGIGHKLFAVYPTLPSGSKLHGQDLNANFDVIAGLAGDLKDNRIFAIAGTRANSELVRVDPKTQSFVPIVSGSAACDLDYAPAGDLVAYIRTKDSSLWISKPDGTNARRVTPDGMATELPKWSPDGSNLAFMGKYPGQRFRIYVVQSSRTILREASTGGDNQGAPTWSPDGRFLAYGDVYCKEMDTCAIHQIDLASGAVSTIAGSHGYGTARWSPDGMHIAALNPRARQLVIFDFAHQRWRRLADDIDGNDVNWSADSRYVYTETSMAGHLRIVRVPTAGGDQENVLDLDSLSKSGGYLSPWFGVTRDGAILMNHVLEASEIYEVSYELR